MWVRLSTWMVSDEGLDVGLGDTWESILDLVDTNAEEVDQSTPLALHFVGDPFLIAGPVYDIVARRDDDHLDCGKAILGPVGGYRPWSPGAVLRFRSELKVGWSETTSPPDVLLYASTVRQLYVRWWRAVPVVGERDTYERDPDSVRSRPIGRMNPWADEKNPDGSGRVISEYLLDLA